MEQLSRINHPQHPLVRGLQFSYIAVAWGFVLSLAAQVYFIGLSLFSSATWLEVHSAVGFSLLLASLMLLLLTALARFPGSIIRLNGLLAVLTFVQVSLVTFVRALGLPMVDALHPVNALALFLTAVIVAYRAQRWVTANRGR
jgi:hypothetical protein